MKSHIYGIILAIIAYACYSFMNGTVKYIKYHAFITSSEAIYFYINILAFLIILSFAFVKKVSLKVKHPVGLIIRITVGIIALNLTFIIINYINISLYYSIIFTSPLIASFLAIIFLKESLSAIKILTLLGGFIGILIIFTPWNHVRFNSLLTLPVLGCFIVSLCNASIWIFTKKYLNKDNIITILFYMFASGSLISLIILLFSDTQAIININLSSLPITLLVIASLFTVGGFFFFTKAVQKSKIQVILPAEYTLLIFGSLFDIFIFHSTVSINTWVGSLVILINSLVAIIYINAKPFLAVRKS